MLGLGSAYLGLVLVELGLCFVNDNRLLSIVLGRRKPTPVNGQTHETTALLKPPVNEVHISTIRTTVVYVGTLKHQVCNETGLVSTEPKTVLVTCGANNCTGYRDTTNSFCV